MKFKRTEKEREELAGALLTLDHAGVIDKYGFDDIHSQIFEEAEE